MRGRFPLPDTEWEPTRGFWAAAAREELALPRCPRCGEWDWYPTGTCATCPDAESVWERLGGRAELFARHAQHRVEQHQAALPAESARACKICTEA